MITEMALIQRVVSKIFGDIVSKAVSDGMDISKNAIKKAVQNRKSYSQNMQTQIYYVIIDALNEFTYNKYKKDEKIYEAAESILKGCISTKDNMDAIKSGLKILVSDVNNDTCQDFLEILYSGICKGDNSDLYKEIDMLWKRRESEYIHGEFEGINQNDREVLRKLNDLKEVLDFIKGNMNGQEGYKAAYYEIPVENRAGEYADKWDKNVFLNNFSERDENAGINIKLKDIYLEKHLPNYIWRANKESSNDLRMLLSEYTVDNNDKKMLLILGQPGIGKSTLITWLLANLIEKKEDILVYQFATDLDSIDWQSRNVLKDIFSIIGLEYDKLENRTLILDGFDEIDIGSDRERILNKLNQELKEWSTLKPFSLIITCRENYIYDLQNIKCDYITLQAWEETQIENFCRTYWKKCGNDVSDDIIEKILENKEIFGIPLILYMILALDITIEKSSSIVDIYDQIFSLKRGGIYDRCYDVEHRINSPKIKEHIHRISQRIAFWIFRNNADKAFIPQEKFEEICENEMRQSGEMGKEIQRDALIGNFFKLKHCEGKETDELQFVHRSIYEYFVAVYFFKSIYKLKTEEEIAGKLGELLKDGQLSEQILIFIKYKFNSIKESVFSNSIKDIFKMMLQDGMTCYTKERYKNIIEQERRVFSNMLEIVGLWNSNLGEINGKIIVYLQCNRGYKLNLKGIKFSVNNFYIKKLDLRGVDLRRANLKGADLRGVDLSRANLSGADLREVDLREVNLSGAYLNGAILTGANLKEVDLSRAVLIGANLIGVDLRGANLNETDLSNADFEQADLRGTYLIGANLCRADLSKAYLSEADLIRGNLNETELERIYLGEVYLIAEYLRGANLYETLFNEKQVNILYKKYDLSMSDVLLSKTDERISYQEYCLKRQKG